MRRATLSPPDERRPFGISWDGVTAETWHASKADAVTYVRTLYPRAKVIAVIQDGRVLTYNTAPNRVKWNPEIRDYVPFIDPTLCVSIIDCRKG